MNVQAADGLYAILGAALGTLYFVLLRVTVRLHLSHSGALHIAPLYVLRYAVTVLAFVLIAQQGAAPLVLTLAGFLLARILVQRCSFRR